MFEEQKKTLFDTNMNLHAMPVVPVEASSERYINWEVNSLLSEYC